VKSKWFHGLKKIDWIDVAETATIPFLAALVLIIPFGLLGYMVAGYTADNLQPFDLAIADGVIGGFIFTATFSEKCTEEARRKLRPISVFYLISTISFVVLGIFIPVDKMETKVLTGWLKWIIPVTFYLGAILFAVAVTLTLANIRAFLTDKKPKARNSRDRS
jgi:hypothetical protein